MIMFAFEILQPSWILNVTKLFLRKYIHARTGSGIRGSLERQLEKKEQRIKGASLRDGLYSFKRKS